MTNEPKKSVGRDSTHLHMSGGVINTPSVLQDSYTTISSTHGSRSDSDSSRVGKATSSGYSEASITSASVPVGATLTGFLTKGSRFNLFLVLSSLGFVGAGVLGLLLDQTLLGVIALATGLVSINYWRHEEEDHENCRRYIVDCWMARFTFVVFSVVAFSIQKDTWFICRTVLIWCLIVCTFYLSRTLQHQRGDRVWVFSHMSFHLFATIGMFHVILGVDELVLKCPGRAG